jgi:hypothetical protein
VRYVAGIFALLTGAAGWFYLFYSRAAHKLSEIEDERLNQKRILLRRIGGVAMLLLGACFFAGFSGLEDPRWPAAAVMGVWLGVFALLLVIVILAMIDVRLTYRLNRNRKGSRP